MEDLLYKRTYTEKCNDMDDVNFLSNFSHKDVSFMAYDEEIRCEFSRLASQCAFIAEELRGTLYMVQGNYGITFTIEADSMRIRYHILAMLKNLLRAAEVTFTCHENKARIEAEYFFR